MSIHESHLVAVSLGNTVDQVVDVAERSTDGGGGFPASKPGVDLQLLRPGLLVGYELEIEIEMLEILRERAPGALDFNHLRLHLDLDAVGNIHGVGGENRLHFGEVKCVKCVCVLVLGEREEGLGAERRGSYLYKRERGKL